jgi:hypothetical protein
MLKAPKFIQVKRTTPRPFLDDVPRMQRGIHLLKLRQPFEHLNLERARDPLKGAKRSIS